MRMHIWTVCAGTLIAASTAQAAVTSASEAGFAVENSVDIKADAKRVYALLATPGHWWNGEHSYSGDAANLSLEPRAGGCFCERILVPSGSPGTVEHARVIYAAPGDRPDC